jgi:hypothetical protein
LLRDLREIISWNEDERVPDDLPDYETLDIRRGALSVS